LPSPFAGRGAEWRLARENRTEQSAEAEHVAAFVDAMNRADRLFGRHVRRRAEERPGSRVRVVVDCIARVDELAGSRIRGFFARVAQHLGKAPIHHLNLAEVPDHHVVRFEVAVNHAVAVGIGHRLAHLLESGQQRTAIQVAGFELFVQRSPFDELHREKRPPVRQVAHFVDRRDGGVLQLPGDVGFLQKSPARRLVAGEPLLEHFQRDGSLHPQIAGPIDDPHSTTTDLGFDRVLGNREWRFLAGGESERW
jgi:hypothetical protein